MATQHPYYVTSQTPQTPQTPWGQPGTPMPTKTANTPAVAGMVLGIVGTAISWVPVVGFLTAGAGYVLSQIGLIKSTKANYGRGQAITGLVLSPLAMTINAAVTVAMVGFAVVAEHNEPKYGDARAQMYELKDAVQEYATINGKLPARLSDLSNGYQIRDPWGGDYKLEKLTPKTFRIISRGVLDAKSEDDATLTSDGVYHDPFNSDRPAKVAKTSAKAAENYAADSAVAPAAAK